ncbi:PREDICTED: uncharacterized protein LOC108579328 [Habropoda laboriosa]|uniref:uncharacterized protein LOC108579328 n=1 Tax=Habropoda laboriosa TaxID=597456 RepID=UPI00083CECE4|nr:PREDICTED: uncharacterized protein LOC108579328 [Habropoda laboriosa]
MSGPLLRFFVVPRYVDHTDTPRGHTTLGQSRTVGRRAEEREEFAVCWIGGDLSFIEGVRARRCSSPAISSCAYLSRLLHSPGFPPRLKSAKKRQKKRRPVHFDIRPPYYLD